MDSASNKVSVEATMDGTYKLEEIPELMADCISDLAKATWEFSVSMREAVEEIQKGFVKAFKSFSVGLREFTKSWWGRNSKERAYRRALMRAYSRSQRNNQTVKRYKHGRTQKTRVKR